MRRLLLALALLAVLATPTAQAQLLRSNLVLAALPPEEDLTPHAGLDILAQAIFSADPTVHAELTGVPVRYTVKDAPEWAVVTISPANDVFPASRGAPTHEHVTMRQFVVQVDALPDTRGERLGTIEIQAVVDAASLRRAPPPASLTITVRFTEAPCELHQPLFAGLVTDAPEAPDEDASEPVRLQSAAARPVTAAALATVGGLGAAGAGVGLLLRRRG